MDSELICETITFNVEMDVIPNEVAEEITNGDYDDQSYEGYMGNVRPFPMLVLQCNDPNSVYIKIVCWILGAL